MFSVLGNQPLQGALGSVQTAQPWSMRQGLVKSVLALAGKVSPVSLFTPCMLSAIAWQFCRGCLLHIPQGMCEVLVCSFSHWPHGSNATD